MKDAISVLKSEHRSMSEWRAIDAAFAANSDPVAGMREHDFRQLFSRIAHLAPAPVGLGEPWKKEAA